MISDTAIAYLTEALHPLRLVSVTMNVDLLLLSVLMQYHLLVLFILV